MMKIRMGFITNSSSTNFLIISDEELTEEYLFNKLGFKNDGRLAEMGHELCESIMIGIQDGPRYFDYDYGHPTYELINKEFGVKAANLFKQMKVAYTYLGSTSSDENAITSFFTMDSFEIEENGFYLNGRNCVW